MATMKLCYKQNVLGVTLILLATLSMSGCSEEFAAVQEFCEKTEVATQERADINTGEWFGNFYKIGNLNAEAAGAYKSGELWVDKDTEIVYIAFQGSSSVGGYSYSDMLCPYYAPNGLPYRWNFEERRLVEIAR